MIEIVKIEKDLFKKELSKKILKSLEIGNNCYASNVNLISKLLIVDMPINNRRIFIINILNFLNWIENQIHLFRTTKLIIPKDIFTYYFTSNHYNEYKKILKELNVLTNIPLENGSWYVKNELAKEYRVHSDYLNDQDICLVILNKSKRERNMKFVCDIDIDKRYSKTIENMELNIKEAITSEIEYCLENEISNRKLRTRISRIFYTKQKRFIKKGKKVNRIYHSFSNVSRIARKHINISLYYIDIKNCQPLLLTALLRKNNLPIDDVYQYDCESGTLYENFIGINGKDRDEVKVQIYKKILFGFNQNSKFNKKFKELYPLTWESIRNIQEESSLALELQNLESEIFNNLIPKKSNHFFTLFDAIYFDDIIDFSDLKKDIDNFFEDLNIKATIEIG